MTNGQIIASLATLDAVADLFEASPREAISPAEVARTVRALKVELFDPLVVAAYEMSHTPFDWTTSTPS